MEDEARRGVVERRDRRLDRRERQGRALEVGREIFVLEEGDRAMLLAIDPNEVDLAHGRVDAVRVPRRIGDYPEGVGRHRAVLSVPPARARPSQLPDRRAVPRGEDAPDGARLGLADRTGSRCRR